MHRFRQLMTLAMASALVCGFLPIAAFANTASVKIAGTPVFSVIDHDGMSGDQRAQIIQSNLDNALVASSDKSPSAVQVVYVKGTPVITVGGFRVVTVTSSSAANVHVTPAVLAQRWANNIKNVLSNRESINNYIAALTGNEKSSTNSAYKHVRTVYVPAGMVLPITMCNTISSSTANVGDSVKAKLTDDITLSDAVIPAGSMLYGKVTEVKAGEKMAHAGVLSIKFDSLRTPDGSRSFISAHFVGGMDKMHTTDGNTFAGENRDSKVKTAAVDGAIGAGAGMLAGMTIGAIAGHDGRGVGSGALAGSVIGAGLGVAESLTLRKGHDVVLGSGDKLKLELDSPAKILVGSASGNI